MCAPACFPAAGDELPPYDKTPAGRDIEQKFLAVSLALPRECGRATPRARPGLGQGLAAGEFAELVRAIREAVTYADVHSTMFRGGEICGASRRRGRDD